MFRTLLFRAVGEEGRTELTVLGPSDVQHSCKRIFSCRESIMTLICDGAVAVCTPFNRSYDFVSKHEEYWSDLSSGSTERKTKQLVSNMDSNKVHLHCTRGCRQRGEGYWEKEGSHFWSMTPYFARTTETLQENKLYPPGANSYLGISRIQNTRANKYIACWNTSAVWNSFLVRYNLREMETCISARQCSYFGF